jgi:hypothetical protein
MMSGEGDKGGKSEGEKEEGKEAECGHKKCKKKFEGDSPAIGCEGCGDWFHITCAKMGEDLYKVLKGQTKGKFTGIKDVLWFCGDCRKKLEKVDERSNEMVKLLEENEALKSRLKTVEEELSRLSADGSDEGKVNKNEKQEESRKVILDKDVELEIEGKIREEFRKNIGWMRAEFSKEIRTVRIEESKRPEEIRGCVGRSGGGPSGSHGGRDIDKQNEGTRIAKAPGGYPREETKGRQYVRQASGGYAERNDSQSRNREVERGTFKRRGERGISRNREPKRVLIVGDSNVGRLKKDIEKQAWGHEVGNVSRGGANITEAAGMVREGLKDFKERRGVILIHAGANDTRNKDESRVKRDFEQAIQDAKRGVVAANRETWRIGVYTILPDDGGKGAYAMARKVNHWLRGKVREWGVELLDVEPAQLDRQLIDGKHYNVPGRKVIAERTRGFIRQVLGEA